MALSTGKRSPRCRDIELEQSRPKAAHGDCWLRARRRPLRRKAGMEPNAKTKRKLREMGAADLPNAILT